MFCGGMCGDNETRNALLKHVAQLQMKKQFFFSMFNIHVENVDPTMFAHENHNVLGADIVADKREICDVVDLVHLLEADAVLGVGLHVKQRVRERQIEHAQKGDSTSAPSPPARSQLDPHKLFACSHGAVCPRHVLRVLLINVGEALGQESKP